MGEDITRDMPADLVSVLRDQSVIVPQDAAVFDLIATWAKAPTATASADVTTTVDMSLVETLLHQTNPTRVTTGVGCA